MNAPGDFEKWVKAYEAAKERHASAENREFVARCRLSGFARIIEQAGKLDAEHLAHLTALLRELDTASNDVNAALAEMLAAVQKQKGVLDGA
ncbi:MAG: hypothetical protein ACK4N5_22490 [Myxococcales bacterium]